MKKVILSLLMTPVIYSMDPDSIEPFEIKIIPIQVNSLEKIKPDANMLGSVNKI